MRAVVRTRQGPPLLFPCSRGKLERAMHMVAGDVPAHRPATPGVTLQAAKRAPSAEWVAMEPNTSWCCEVSRFDNPVPELRAA